MSQRSIVHAAFAAAGLLGISVAANADTAFSIDAGAIDGQNCFGNATCDLPEADITTTGGNLEKKILNDATGFGVSTGPSGPEIDIGQKLRVDFGESRTVTAIQILFLFNGPEFNDRAEIAKITADDVVYTLSTLIDADDGSATWSGPGVVTKCSEYDDPSLTLNGTGCFLITDPFPGVVGRLDFTAIAGNPPFPGGAGNNESDYSIGFIDVAAAAAVDLGAACASPSGCPVAAVNGQVAAELNSVDATNSGGSTEAVVTQVKLPDCRYIPKECVALLPPWNDYGATDDDARAILITLGVIKPLDPSGPNKLNPAAQLLNVKPLLPPEVTSQFGPGSVPPAGLPSLYIGSRWRGQASNQQPYWFDGLFFKTDPNVVFSGTFEGSIDVLKLTGSQLGCFTTPNLLAWDVITSVSELAKSTGGRYIDTVTNVDCVNPTKVSGTRLSLYSVNFEVVPNTYGPTIKSFKPKVTVNNDAVFARLVQSLWHDLGESRANYACKKADPVPSSGAAPLSKPVCNTLASRWLVAEIKLNLCVAAAFFPANSYRTLACNGARDAVAAFEAALPATATGLDPYNRLGELKSRVDVFQHVWTERFLNSLKPGGFCSEWGNCSP